MTVLPNDAAVVAPPGETPHVHSVAHYIVHDVPVARLNESAATVRGRLPGQRYADASYLFVIDDDRKLLGVATLTDILAAPCGIMVSELMLPRNCHVVAPDTDREQAATMAIHADVASLAVCGTDGRFIGAVPATALMLILRDEHLEDLHHIVGIMGKSDAARAALTAPPFWRAYYRLPWLLVGMAGSALATIVMSQFETLLSAQIAITFFIPAIVYLADAVGTQTEAVAVRSLSLTQAEMGKLLWGEVGTGVLIGVTLGGLALPLVWLGFGSLALGVTVAIALAVASSLATTVGFLLPWLFARLGYDPALGSGPVATVIQDTLSLLSYILTASLLL
jgi:magnesium transporter